MQMTGNGHHENDDNTPEENVFSLLFDDSDDNEHEFRGPMTTISKEDVHQHFLPKNLATELYDLLKCTHAIFKHFGINYWLTGGSMIGYTRHSGIIPWDDDIDICCFREDKEKVFSEEVQEAFRLNNVKVTENQTFDIIDPTLSKIYRNTANSKANTSGEVPYPFIDIFYMKKPDKYNDTIRFLSKCNGNHYIYPDELYPIQQINFGPVTANTPRDPLPQLDRGYGKNWPKEGQIHIYNHVTKQRKEGPIKIFDVSPFLNVSAAYDASLIRTEVILPGVGM